MREVAVGELLVDGCQVATVLVVAVKVVVREEVVPAQHQMIECQSKKKL